MAIEITCQADYEAVVVGRLQRREIEPSDEMLEEIRHMYRAGFAYEFTAEYMADRSWN